MNVNSGIYRIVNLSNGKCYVGQTVNFTARKANHFSELKHGKHKNKYLQHVYNKYGAESFAFEILEHISIPESLKEDVARRDYLVPFEQKWIDRFNCASPDCGYNFAPSAGTVLGVKRSEEVRRRTSERQSTRCYRVTFPDGSTETIYNLARFSREHGLDASAMSAILKGKHHTHAGYSVVELNEDGSEIGIPQRVPITREEHSKRIAQGRAKQLYRVTYPNGDIVEIYNLYEFARLNNVVSSGLYLVASGKAKQHKGFKVVKIDP